MQSNLSEQAQTNAQTESTEDFKLQFLNNHISTILEDFDGENVVSEFSLTRRTNQGTEEEDF